MMPILRWTRGEDGNITIRVLLGNVEQERFSLPGWDPEDGRGPPLASWLADFYELSEQERRDQHQGSFEKYVLARREAGQEEEGDAEVHASR
jgi:hypothetical protein